MDVAVIGMSCRFPEADNIDEFWNNLISGKNSVRSIPKERWYMSGEGDLVAGFLKCPLDEFDANFFNISPKEAPYMDPQQRLFLEVSWESLEHAGIPPSSLNGSNTGVYLGIGSDEYFRTQLDTSEDTMYKVVGNTFSAATGRLSFFLNLHGPSVPIEATCASSAVAIHTACAGLRNGECSLALAGGVNVLLETSTTYPSALTSSSCRSFDSSASGFAPAEGCGVIVLKLLEDAMKDKNSILGVIRGSFLNHTGKSTSFGTPNALSEEQVIRDGLRAARVDPIDVTYVEAHAGGTAIGDPIEVRAISNVFKNSERVGPLILGAFKTNIGHPLAAAGVAGVIKMLLCMKYRTIPQHLHLNEVHPDINFEEIPAIVPRTNITWESKHGPLIGAVNCFGITGTNVHMILQEPPAPKPKMLETFPPLKILTISAKDEIALESLREKYKTKLDTIISENQLVDLSDFTFSANTCRSHLSNRVALIGSSLEEMSKKLGALDYIRGTVPSTHAPIVFLFTGHGCQYFGMAKSLYKTNAVFRKAFDECNLVYQNNLGMSLKEFLYEEGHGHDLSRTKYSQPAIFSIEYCLYKFWTSLGVKPDFVLGHSIGEFAASVAAGLISFQDGMKLVCCRSLLVDQLPEGRMVAIGAPLAHVIEIIAAFQKVIPNTWLDIACMNSVDQTVVSTEIETANKFKQFITERIPGVKSKVLPSQHAFHSRSMDPILEEFEKIASEVIVNEPNCKYISGLLNREVKPEEINGTYWRHHCRDMVSFSKAIDILIEKGCKVYLEVSPQPTLLNFLMANNSTGSELVSCPSIRSNQECWTTALNTLAKIYVNTNTDIKFENLYKGNQVDLPTYAFNRKKYWGSTSARGSGHGPSGEKMYHSLLGWKLNLAGCNDIRFYNYISNTSTGYVHDHIIADHVIIPAACYVEMMLTIARKEFGKKYPVIENLQVLRALVLDSKPKQVQTKAVYDGANLSISIFSENDGEWIQHVQATLNLESCPESEPEDQPGELEKIQENCSVEKQIEVIYTRLDASGITMGPLFKSLERATRTPDSSELLARFKSVRTKAGEFMCHPITVDAMVQAFWDFKMSKSGETPFALPVGIDKFTWYLDDNCSFTENVYFHVKNDNKAVLYSSNGKILGTMENLIILESTVSAFLKSIAAVEYLPQFMSKDIIPVQILNSNDRVEMKTVENLSLEFINQELEFLKKFNMELFEQEEKVGKLTYYYIIKALLELGWQPIVGSPVKKENLILARAPLVDMRVYDQFLMIMAEEKLISPSAIPNEWVLLKSLPTLSELSELIAEMGSESEKKTTDYAYIKNLGESLTSILKGEVDPLNALFSKKEFSVTEMYSRSQRCHFDCQILKHAFEGVFQNSSRTDFGKKLRILEVGAGSGSATSVIIEVLTKLEIPFDYTFTDIGLSLLTEGRNKFAAHSNNMTFKHLDIEKDPKTQGFNPYSYDIVIALQVLHATEDLKVTLDNVRHLLVPDGYFFLTELVGYYRDFAISFDLLKSYWRMNDFRKYVTVDAQTWTNLLDKTGFTKSISFTDQDCRRGLFVSRANSELFPYRPLGPTLNTSNPAWIIFGNESDTLHKILGANLNNVGRHAFHVNQASRFDKVNDSFGLNPKRVSDFQQLSHVLKNYQIEGIIYLWGISAQQKNISLTSELRKVQENISGGFLNVMKMRITNNWTSKIFLITSGAEEVNPAQGTLWGIFDTYLNEYSDASGLAIDVDPSMNENQTVSKIFNLLWDSPSERGVYLKDDAFSVGRLHSMDSVLPFDEITVPKSGKYKLANPVTFEFTPIKDTSNEGIEVSVRAVGLNFRDLLLSKALLETDHPDSVGLEFAGVITKTQSGSGYNVGDRVGGLTCKGALASHITITNPDLLFRIPENMSFAGAATIPVAYGTCYLAMVEIANLQPNEKVLIHTGSGGVGLAGIQLARYLGAEVFVTAGTEKKRTYLRECIGLKNVYNSRTHDYKEEILRDTNGTGIDVVINTLTGPGFKEATLDVTSSKGGRFIELSKLNVWTVDDVKGIRPDVQYTILDAFDMILRSNPSLTSSLAKLAQLFVEKKLDILYHSLYPLASVKSAFKYFFGHNHIGKVVVEIPENNEKISSVTLYNPESTYMVTGGIGGLGFEVGKYLWENNGHVLLVGRSKASEEMEKKIESYGERMRYVQCDIGDYEKCKNLVESINPPLRGIFHCAGVFANGFLIAQSNESFTKSFNPKVYGSFNLHQVTKDKHLDHFVMFSSIAAIVGSTGLSNYSAANRYLDTLTNYRANQCGLPGLTINWGPWSEVGTAADYVAGMFKSFYHFSPEIGIQSMERAIRLRLHDIVIADMELTILETAPRLAPYFSELTQTVSGGKASKLKIKGNTNMSRPSDVMLGNLANEVREADHETRKEKMETLVEAIFRIHSGLNDSDKVDRNQPLALMGMDSLIGMEMRLCICKLFDVTISTNAVQEHNSVTLFAAYVCQQVFPDSTDEISPVIEKVENKLEKSSKIDIKLEKHEKNSKSLGKKIKPIQIDTVKKGESKSSLPRFVTRQLQKLSHDKKSVKVIGSSG